MPSCVSATKGLNKITCIYVFCTNLELFEPFLNKFCLPTFVSSLSIWVEPFFFGTSGKKKKKNMGKQGPCYHCGVTSTPLWRNGPPEKPVLCNACGSRWRTKGTLANYTPLHARAEPGDYEDHRFGRGKNISININKNKEVKVPKRKQYTDDMVFGGIMSDYNQGFQKFIDDDTSNRSSSGSAISNSDAQFGSADASDLTGPAQSVVWDSMVPSRKRTCVNRPKPSPVEKLTRDLHTILHEQQSSCLSGSSEEDLLLESEMPMGSVEIGHGTVLIRHPSGIARDEESEASSLSVDRKHYKRSEAYSRPTSIPLYNNARMVSSPSAKPGMERSKNSSGQGMRVEHLRRDISQHEKLQGLGNHNSPLCHINLKELLNFEEFARLLNDDERRQLLKYLPPVDTSQLPDSLEYLFDSPIFEENLSSFQKLLSEGVFDRSFLGVKAEDYKTLRRLALSSSMKCKWVECLQQLQDSKNTSGESTVGRYHANLARNLINGKRVRDIQSQNFPEAKMMMKSPKGGAWKGSCENKDLLDSDGSCFSPRSLFALPPDNSTLMLDSFPVIDESNDQDLLVDVPSNGSFAQAELLHPALSFGSQQASTGSSSGYPNALHP